MLDPRVYRAGFVPVLLALVFAAFSLADRPRPLQTTLAPDAFDAGRALGTLGDLARRFPERRAGSTGDERLGALLAQRMAGAGFRVRTVRSRGATLDGRRELQTVIGTRIGQPGPMIVVVAHRDAAGPVAEAELSATAGLDELIRVFQGRRTRRTLTLVSTSGGSGGGAGAAETVRSLREQGTPVDAVLVLGDLASSRLRKPWVLPWSDGPRLAPIRLRRTVEAAVRAETGQEAGGPRATTQLARLAFPFSTGEEGRFNVAGIPAVSLSASGGRGPRAGAPVSADHLRVFGRAALRTIDALDGGRALAERPSAEVVTRGKLLPPWAIRVLVGALLLPPLLAVVDAVARARRRGIPLLPWLGWLGSLALPFLLAVAAIRLLGASGVVTAPGAAVPAGAVPVDGVVLALIAVLLSLGALAAGRVARLLGVRGAPEGPGPAVALAAVTVALAVAVWARNPFAAALLVLPAHAWLLGPQLALRRGAALALALGALAPVLVVLAVYASALGLSPLGLPWSLTLLAAGGQLGPPALAALCALAGCAVAAGRLALGPGPEPPAAAPAPSLRGPAGHAGPGSLGGTPSAIRLGR